MRRLEKEFGLMQVKNSREAERSSPKKGELEQAVRKQEPSVRMLLQEYISSVLQEPVPFQEFAAKLQENGIEVKLNQASTGTISGISFSLNGISFKGSKLGKGYTWNALKQKGLYYENGYAAEHEPIRHEYSQDKRTADSTDPATNSTTANTAAERTGTFGNAFGTFEPTGESEITKQSRIAENFARLEKELCRDRQRPQKTFKRDTGLSR